MFQRKTTEAYVTIGLPNGTERLPIERGRNLTAHSTAYSSKKQLADTETGEVFDLVAVPRRERTYIRGGWFKGMSVAIEKIAVSPRFTDGEKAVFVYLLARLDWENYLYLQINEVAEATGKTRQHISRTLKRLTEEGVIYRGHKVGRSYTYRLNPEVALKSTDGTGRRVQWELHQELKKRGMKIVEGANENDRLPTKEDIPLF